MVNFHKIMIHLFTQNNIIISLVGGNVEFILFGENMISTGANDDLSKTTNIVLGIVTKYGINNVEMIQFTSDNNQKQHIHNKLSLKLIRK